MILQIFDHLFSLSLTLQHSSYTESAWCCSKTHWGSAHFFSQAFYCFFFRLDDFYWPVFKGINSFFCYCHLQLNPSCQFFISGILTPYSRIFMVISFYFLFLLRFPIYSPIKIKFSFTSLSAVIIIALKSLLANYNMWGILGLISWFFSFEHWSYFPVSSFVW